MDVFFFDEKFGLRTRHKANKTFVFLLHHATDGFPIHQFNVNRLITANKTGIGIKNGFEEVTTISNRTDFGKIRAGMPTHITDLMAF